LGWALLSLTFLLFGIKVSEDAEDIVPEGEPDSIGLVTHLPIALDLYWDCVVKVLVPINDPSASGQAE